MDRIPVAIGRNAFFLWAAACAMIALYMVASLVFFSLYLLSMIAVIFVTFAAWAEHGVPEWLPGRVRRVVEQDMCVRSVGNAVARWRAEAFDTSPRS